MTVVNRHSEETDVRVEISPGSGKFDVNTSIGFLDHMLGTLSRYSGLDVKVVAKGDIAHHISEDVAITFGTALAEIVPAEATRYGESVIPMDDALVQVVVDLGGRPYYQGPLPLTDYEHWMRSFCISAKATIHVQIIRGIDEHHVVEASFKALGLALRKALAKGEAVFSTKGTVNLETQA